MCPVFIYGEPPTPITITIDINISLKTKKNKNRHKQRFDDEDVLDPTQHRYEILTHVPSALYASTHSGSKVDSIREPPRSHLLIAAHSEVVILPPTPASKALLDLVDYLMDLLAIWHVDQFLVNVKVTWSSKPLGSR